MLQKQHTAPFFRLSELVQMNAGSNEVAESAAII